LKCHSPACAQYDRTCSRICECFGLRRRRRIQSRLQTTLHVTCGYMHVVCFALSGYKSLISWLCLGVGHCPEIRRILFAYLLYMPFRIRPPGYPGASERFSTWTEPSVIYTSSYKLLILPSPRAALLYRRLFYSNSSLERWKH
jgi:hypothetical protein